MCPRRVWISLQVLIERRNDAVKVAPGDLFLNFLKRLIIVRSRGAGSGSRLLKRDCGGVRKAGGLACDREESSTLNNVSGIADKIVAARRKPAQCRSKFPGLDPIHICLSIRSSVLGSLLGSRPARFWNLSGAVQRYLQVFLCIPI